MTGVGPARVVVGGGGLQAEADKRELGDVIPTSYVGSGVRYTPTACFLPIDLSSFSVC